MQQPGVFLEGDSQGLGDQSQKQDLLPGKPVTHLEDLQQVPLGTGSIAFADGLDHPPQRMFIHRVIACREEHVARRHHPRVRSRVRRIDPLSLCPTYPGFLAEVSGCRLTPVSCSAGFGRAAPGRLPGTFQQIKSVVLVHVCNV